LLPGTLSVGVRDNVLMVHVIDCTQPIQRQLARLEQIVAALFAIRLESEQYGARAS